MQKKRKKQAKNPFGVMKKKKKMRMKSRNQNSPKAFGELKKDYINKIKNQNSNGICQEAIEAI